MTSTLDNIIYNHVLFSSRNITFIRFSIVWNYFFVRLAPLLCYYFRYFEKWLHLLVEKFIDMILPNLHEVTMNIEFWNSTTPLRAEESLAEWLKKLLELKIRFYIEAHNWACRKYWKLFVLGTSKNYSIRAVLSNCSAVLSTFQHPMYESIENFS